MELDWTLVAEAFEACLQVPSSERLAYLQNHYGDQPMLIEEVKSLLNEHDEADEYFESIEQKMQEKVRFKEIEIPNQVGKQIDKYHLVEEIGRGGMAVVYKAARKDGTFDQEVAIKILKRGIDTDEVLLRFQYERQILANLQHPQIAQIMDGGVTEEGLPYFAMEYIEAQRITDWVKQKKAPLKERINLFKQVVNAINYAHQNLVVHRDLKPSNVLVNTQGNVKLLDFGIAKLLDKSDQEVLKTQTHVKLLTPNYASPEQISGQNITVASDIYQLGLLFYELLTEEKAFDLNQKSLSEKERIILEQSPSLPSKKAPAYLQKNIKKDLDTIVLTCLQKDPKRRYSSADQLLADIERYEQQRPIMAKPATWHYQLGKFLVRNRTVVSIVALAFAVLVSATLYYIKNINDARLRAEEQYQRAEAEYERAVEHEEVSQGVVNIFTESMSAIGGSENEDNSRMLSVVTSIIETVENEDRKLNYFELLALKYITHENYEKALEIFNRQLELLEEHFPEDTNRKAVVQIDIGKTLLRMDQKDSAQYWLYAALENKSAVNLSNRAEAYEALASMYFEEQNYTQVIALLDPVVAKSPAVASVYLLLGRAYQKQQDYLKAEALFKEMIERFGKGSEMALIKGNLYLMSTYALTGQVQKAEALLEAYKNYERNSLADIAARMAYRVSNLSKALQNSSMVRLP
ncbi:MAG: protein kinase [Thermonemataceae bacterium]